MKNSKAIFLLTLGVILLAAANVAVRMSGGEGARIVRRSVLDATANDAQRLTIRRDGHRLTLVKAAKWTIVEPFAGSAEAETILRLLDALATTPIRETGSDAELLRLGRTRADFALEEPRLSVSLEDESGTRTISFGSRTPTKDGVYAALGEVDSVFVMPTSLVATVDVPFAAFRRKSLFDTDETFVDGFEIRRSTSARLTFVRTGDRWTVDGQTASASRVRNVLNGIFTSSAVDFVWPVGATNESGSVSTSLLAVYGLDPETAVTASFKFHDGVDRQVSFGKTADEKTVYALVQNGAAIVTVPAAVRDLASQERLAFTDARLFPIEASGVASVSLSDGGVDFVLARGEGGGWRLEAPIAAAADAKVAADVVASVLTLTSADLCEGGTLVSLFTNAPPVSVRRERILGKSRFEDLRSREILRLGAESARRIVVTSGGVKRSHVSVVYGRDRRAWNVESTDAKGVVREEAVSAILAAVNPLKSERIVKLKVSASELDAYGLGSPALVVAFDLEGEEAVRRNVIIGGEAPGGRYATVGSADAVFVLPQDVVRVFETPLVGE